MGRALAELPAEALAVPVRAALTVALVDSVPLGVKVGVEGAEGVRCAVREAVGVLAWALREGEGWGLEERLSVGLGEGVGEEEAEVESVPQALGVGVPEALVLSVEEVLGVAVLVEVGESVPEAVLVPPPPAGASPPPPPPGLPETLGEGVALALREREGEEVPVGEGVAVGQTEAERLADSVALPQALCVEVRESEAELHREYVAELERAVKVAGGEGLPMAEGVLGLELGEALGAVLGVMGLEEGEAVAPLGREALAAGLVDWEGVVVADKEALGDPAPGLGEEAPEPEGSTLVVAPRVAEALREGVLDAVLQGEGEYVGLPKVRVAVPPARVAVLHTLPDADTEGDRE